MKIIAYILGLILNAALIFAVAFLINAKEIEERNIEHEPARYSTLTWTMKDEKPIWQKKGNYVAIYKDQHKSEII